MANGELKSLKTDFTNWVHCAIDPVMGYLVGVDSSHEV